MRLTAKAQAEMEEKWRLEKEAIELLGVVNAEWQSDPTSVQHFDLRIVNRTNEVLKRLNELDYLR